MLTPAQIKKQTTEARFSSRMDGLAEDLHDLKKKLDALNDLVHDDIGNPIIRIKREEADLLAGELRGIKAEIDTLVALREPDRRPPSLPVY